MVSVAFRLNRIWTHLETSTQAHLGGIIQLPHKHMRGCVKLIEVERPILVCGTTSWAWAWSAYKGGRQSSASIHQAPARLRTWCHQHLGSDFPSMVDRPWTLSQNEPVPSSVMSRVFVTAAGHSEAGVFLSNTVSLKFAIEGFHFSCLGLLLFLLN